jgi:hypothetical protein
VDPDWVQAVRVEATPHYQRRQPSEPRLEIVMTPVAKDISLDELRALLARFDRLENFEPVEEDGKPALRSDGRWAVGALLARDHPTVLDPTQLHDAIKELVGDLDLARSDAPPHLIPALPCGDRLAVLALWWAVLFALSNVARYEPDTWWKTLDVDRSPLAVPLEDCLAYAPDALPHAVLEALLGRRVHPHSYS